MKLVSISGEREVLGRNAAIKLINSRYTQRHALPPTITQAWLLAVRRFWQQLPRKIAGIATNGNRVGQTRTAQRRVDVLTNSGAPRMRVEASQNYRRSRCPSKL